MQRKHSITFWSNTLTIFRSYKALPPSSGRLFKFFKWIWLLQLSPTKSLRKYVSPHRMTPDLPGGTLVITHGHTSCSGSWKPVRNQLGTFPPPTTPAHWGADTLQISNSGLGNSILRISNSPGKVQSIFKSHVRHCSIICKTGRLLPHILRNPTATHQS